MFFLWITVLTSQVTWAGGHSRKEPVFFLSLSVLVLQWMLVFSCWRAVLLFEDKEETEKKNRDCGVLNFSKILYFLYEIFYRKCSDHTSIPVMLLFIPFCLSHVHLLLPTSSCLLSTQSSAGTKYPVIGLDGRAAFLSFGFWCDSWGFFWFVWIIWWFGVFLLLSLLVCLFVVLFWLISVVGFCLFVFFFYLWVWP